MRFLLEIELWLNAINLNEKIPIKQTRWVDVIAFKTLAYQAAIATAGAAAAATKVSCDQYLATAAAAATTTRVHNIENNYQFHLSTLTSILILFLQKRGQRTTLNEFT